jgi:hypothetical protein
VHARLLAPGVARRVGSARAFVRTQGPLARPLFLLAIFPVLLQGQCAGVQRIARCSRDSRRDFRRATHRQLFQQDAQQRVVIVLARGFLLSAFHHQHKFATLPVRVRRQPRRRMLRPALRLFLRCDAALRRRPWREDASRVVAALQRVASPLAAKSRETRRSRPNRRRH